MHTRTLSHALAHPNHLRIAAPALAATLLACAAQESSNLNALFAVEDARPTDPAALAPVFSLLNPSTDGATLAVVVRAVGRLQRPAFVDSLAPFLSHGDERVRAEAANAIAQSVQPGRDTGAVVRARSLLLERLAASAEADRGILARSLGRLPHESPDATADAAERIARASDTTLSVRCDRVRQAAALDSMAPAPLFGTMHGIYSAARRARSLGCAAATLAREALGYRAAVTNDTVVWVRELAVLALQAANQGDTAVVAGALRDADPRVRRVGMRPPSGAPPSFVLRAAETGLADSAPMVRIDAVRVLAGLRTPEACALSRTALADPAAHVRAGAIDALTATCSATISVPLLDSLVRLLPSDTTNGATSWHLSARALVGLARSAPTMAAAHFGRFRVHPVWQVRAALAAAARAAGDSAVLLELLQDRDANVREETIAHLAQLSPTLKVRAVRAGLEASEYQTVLAAAQAARDVPEIEVSALAAALVRLTRRQEETSRDPRRELLERIAERGSAADTATLRPFVSDYDTLIARRAAEVLTHWTGRPVQAALASRSAALETAPSGATYLRVTLSTASGGGGFLVRLFPGEARGTIARVARLAREGSYNGSTLHRVVPNFVVQGGSPDANEYVGDGTYMRDELGLHSHTRGTLGISTRGRDTGDAQIFINLVDNFRLDHDYTVFGEVVEGMDVVDRLLAGAVMSRVEVVVR